MPEPTPTPPEVKEPLDPGQQVFVKMYEGQLENYREKLVSIGTEPDEVARLCAVAKDIANKSLRELGINAELT